MVAVVSEEVVVSLAVAIHSSLAVAVAREAFPADSVVLRAVSTSVDMGPRMTITAAHQPTHKTIKRHDEEDAERMGTTRKSTAVLRRTKRHGRLRLRRNVTRGYNNSVESAWSSLLRSSSFPRKP